MNKFYRCWLPVVFVIVITLGAGGGVFAQRARTVGDQSGSDTRQKTPAPAATTTAAAPRTVKAKYEGGIFGYNQKQTGTLNFDDANTRLLFRNKKGGEYLSIPYHSIAAAYADTKSRRPTAATVAGSIPLPYGLNLPALFIKKKYRYLTMQFNDPDTGVQGTTSFKLDNKEVIASVLTALAAKADLTQRGEAFVRRPKTATTQTGQPTPE